jgi:hypothetical protein
MPGGPETLDYSALERGRVALRYAWHGLNWVLTENGVFVSGTLILFAGLWVVSGLVRLRSSRQVGDARHMITCLFMLGFFVLLPLEYGVQSPWWYGGYLYRYVLPVLPLGLILSLIGLRQVLVAIGLLAKEGGRMASPSVFADHHRARVAGRIVMVLLAAAVIGRAVSFTLSLSGEIENYRVIVGFNEGYRRSVADWLRQNTTEDARIAESFLGVGVLGYYAQRHIVDASGLTEPEVLSFWAADGDPRPSDPERLQFLDAKEISHVVGGPGLDAFLGGRGVPITTLSNATGNLSWSGVDFNTTVIYRYEPNLSPPVYGSKDGRSTAVSRED